jgi:hypothetical protein
MIRLSVIFALSAALEFVPVAAFAVTNATNAAPLRHLVYSFTYGAQGNLTVHTEQGIGYPGAGPDSTRAAAAAAHGAGAQGGGGGEATSGSGVLQSYNGEIHDVGTITVDVVREQPDTGLIVTISEQATQTRKADPATCVVYGTTTVICDPNKTVNSEELTLLRFLGRNFIDPNKLDEKGHWRLDESNAASSMTADYGVAPGKNGAVSVQETRVVKDLGGRPATTDVTTTIVYDLSRQVPTSIQEYAVRRDSSSGAGVMKTTVQTTLSLVSDSLAKP